jgi:hypothetical protein
MIIEEVVQPADEDDATTTRTTVFWSAGHLHNKINDSMAPKNVTGEEKPGVAAATGAAEKENGKQEEEKNYLGTQLSKREYEAMKYMGILDSYLKSNRPQTAAIDMNEGVAGNERSWNKCETQKWRFKIAFFIVYTIFTIVNFVLIYNMYNYYALVLEIVNLSVTYLLLLFAL